MTIPFKFRLIHGEKKDAPPNVDDIFGIEASTYWRDYTTTTTVLTAETLERLRMQVLYGCCVRKVSE